MRSFCSRTWQLPSLFSIFNIISRFFFQGDFVIVKVKVEREMCFSEIDG